MPDPTFSIVTPSLNQPDWLRLCVASVADQQSVSVQHIIQDAGSAPGAFTGINSGPHLEVFVESDTGMYDAINRGLRRARGEILAYLNCDEQYLPGALACVAAFFLDHPEVDILFGNIVMVDQNGTYLCHRKVQVPLLYHTWTCQLSTLSCAMFFRRRLIESGRFFFNDNYRCGGDGEWMVRLLRAGVVMAALGSFTSVFTRTGENLGRDARALEENRRLASTAPTWIRVARPLWLGQHRLRRWLGGAYRQKAFEFALYTPSSPVQRVRQQVRRPVFRQKW